MTNQLDFNDYVVDWSPTGSRYICDPPVTGTDKDTVVLVKRGYEKSFDSDGFTPQTTRIEYESIGEFVSWRRGDENLIATTDEGFYNRFVKATEMAKKANLLKKQDRIDLFQRILYNV